MLTYCRECSAFARNLSTGGRASAAHAIEPDGGGTKLTLTASTAWRARWL